MDPHNTIKQALAIAIVRQKRKTNKDADEWRIKAAWLEQQLVQEQDNHLALKQWTCSVLQQTSAAPAAEPMTSKAQNHMPDSIVLPPLVLGPSYSRDASSSHGTAYASLQHQLLLAAKTCAYADYAAVAEVLDGKAAALSDMLLTNLQMLQSLASQHTAAPRQRQGGNSLITPSPAVATGRLLATTRFVQETLLHVPSSSLRSAYMRQCAALVAALLSGTSTAASIHQQRQTAAKEKYPAAATSPVQDLDAGATAGQPEALAVETVQFMQQLLRHKMRAGSSPSVTSAPNTEQQQIDAVSAAATAMLQQLSTFPCTALLMSLSLAQQLQQYVQQLQQAKAAQASAQLGNLSSDVLQMASTAVEVTAQVFEASHELLAELDEALLQLPAWTVALAECKWTARAIADLVSLVSAMYSSCQELQQYQPLLATSICELAASLATRLQHAATDADAPSMREREGALLRSACAGLCVKLRDLFMP